MPILERKIGAPSVVSVRYKDQNGDRYDVTGWSVRGVFFADSWTHTNAGTVTDGPEGEFDILIDQTTADAFTEGFTQSLKVQYDSGEGWVDMIDKPVPLKGYRE